MQGGCLIPLEIGQDGSAPHGGCSYRHQTVGLGGGHSGPHPLGYRDSNLPKRGIGLASLERGKNGVVVWKSPLCVLPLHRGSLLPSQPPIQGGFHHQRVPSQGSHGDNRLHGWAGHNQRVCQYEKVRPTHGR